MALFTRELIKTTYSDIGTRLDTCYCCEIALREKCFNKKINLDEMNSEIRNLKGKLNSKKIVKFRHSGREIIICSKCLEDIYNEVFEKTDNTIDLTNNNSEEVVEDKKVNNKNASNKKA